jgi:hypothetical protein
MQCIHRCLSLFNLPAPTQPCVVQWPPKHVDLRFHGTCVIPSSNIIGRPWYVACDSDQIASAECSYYYFAAATTDVITSTIQLSCRLGAPESVWMLRVLCRMSWNKSWQNRVGQGWATRRVRGGGHRPHLAHP